MLMFEIYISNVVFTAIATTYNKHAYSLLFNIVYDVHVCTNT